MIKYNEEDVIKICNNSLSMAKAASELGIHYNTFIRIAKKIGCYKPNPSGKGTKKKSNGSDIPLEDILNGKHPQYQSFKLKNKLIKQGIKKNECEICELNN